MKIRTDLNEFLPTSNSTSSRTPLTKDPEKAEVKLAFIEYRIILESLIPSKLSDQFFVAKFKQGGPGVKTSCNNLNKEPYKCSNALLLGFQNTSLAGLEFCQNILAF